MGVFPISLLGFVLFFERLHNQSLVLCRANICAVTAAGAVQLRNLNAEVEAFHAFADGFLGNKAFRCILLIFFIQKERTNDRMRADIRALVTLNAVVHLPFRHEQSNAALFELRGAVIPVSVFMTCEGRYRQVIAFITQHRTHHVLEEVRGARKINCIIFGICPSGRNVHLDKSVDTTVHRLVIHVDDIVALMTVGFHNGILQMRYCLFQRQNAGEFKERRLNDHIGTVAQANLLCNLGRVQNIELNVVFGQIAFHLSRQMFLKFAFFPRAVQQESAAFTQTAQQIVLMHIGLLRAGDKVCFIQQIRGTNLTLAETQMRNGQTAGFLRIVEEIALCILIGVITDDLNGLFVCADRAVGTESPELATGRAFLADMQDFRLIQGKIRHIIFNGDSEVVLRLIFFEVAEYGQQMGRNGILRAHAVTAAHDDRVNVRIIKCRTNVHVERLAKGSFFLRTIQNRNLLHILRQSFQEVFAAERTIQTYLNHTELVALFRLSINDFFHCFTSGAHENDDVFCVRITIVIKEMIRTTGLLRNLRHVLFNDGNNVFIVMVGGFQVLEENIRRLGGAHRLRTIRIHRTIAKRLNGFMIHHFFQIFKVPNRNFIDFMRRTEAIKEMDKRQRSFNCGQMRNSAQIHYFLYGAGTKEGKAGHARRVDIRVIAVDRQCVAGDGTCGNMKYAWQILTGNFVHVRNHQQQALGCCICTG